ncbi:unnamed protein product [Lampetra planeri]
MDTRRTARAGVQEAEDTAGSAVPETAEGANEQPGPNESLPGHREEGESLSDGLRLAHASPAIAAAAAEGVANLNLGSDIDSAGAAASPPSDGASLSARQAITAAVRADARPSRGDIKVRSSTAVAALHQRLPPLKEFVAEEGDWGGFQRRFLAHQEMAGWSDDEALCALPALLDGDALAALTSASRDKRSTLQMALQLLAGVYEPSAECRQRFYDRQRGAKESPLAYRTSLLALAKTAFPRMDDQGVDAMVTEKILLLADDLDVAIVAQEDVEMGSLQAARLLHANLLSQRRKASRAAAGRTVAAVTSPTEEVYAADFRQQQRMGARADRDGPTRPDRPSSPPALPRCYNCGVRGHVALGCRSPRQRGTTPRRDAGPPPPPPKLHRHDPASRGTPHTIVRGDGDPFIAVLNVGSQAVVIPQGTVLAHATPVPCAPGVTGSRPTTPAGDAEGLATSATDSLCDEHLPANDLPADDLPAAPVPCDGPAARTRAKMRRLL